MPIAEASYELQVLTTADLTGLDKTKHTIEELTARAQELDAAISNAQRVGISVPDSEMAQLDKLKGAIAELTKNSDASITSHKKIHESLELIGVAAGQALGPIGELAHFMASPYLLAVSGVVLAIKMLVDEHQKWLEAAEKNIAASREQAELFSTSHATALRDAADELAAFTVRMDHARDSVDGVTQAMKRQIDAAQELKSATDNIADAIEKRGEAYIKMAYQGVTAEALILQAQQQARKAKEAAADAEATAEINAHLATISRERTRAGEAGTRLESERANDARHDEMILDAQGKLDDAKKQKDALDKAADDAKLKLAELQKEQGKTYTLPGAAPGMAPTTVTVDNTAAIAEQQKIIDQAAANDDMIEKQKDRIATYTREQKSIEANIKRDEDLVASIGSLIETQGDEIQAIKDKIDATRHATAVIDQINDETSVANLLNTIKAHGANATPQEQAYAGAATGPLNNAVIARMQGKLNAALGETGQQRAQDLDIILNQILGLLGNIALHPGIRGADDFKRRLTRLEGIVQNSNQNVRQ